MSKRPPINFGDLSAVTVEMAAPMPEAVQRAPAVAPDMPDPRAGEPFPEAATGARPERVATADLAPLSFKVPPAFRRRFRQRAATADLKLNELLFEALDAWEQARGLET